MKNFGVKSEILLVQYLKTQMIVGKNIWNQIWFRWWLALKKTLKHCIIIIVVKSVFHEDSKYYPQVFFDVCLQML